MSTKKILLIPVLLIVLAGIAWAAVTNYAQYGRHSETRPLMAASQFEQRNSGNTGWQAVSFGSTIGTITQGNDARLPPTPTAANKLLYDTGSAISETAACGTAGTMLVGGSPPSCSASGSLSTQLTTPSIVSAGSLTLTADSASVINTFVGSTLLTQGSSSGIQVYLPFSMNNQVIHNVGAAVTSGDALSYPPYDQTEGSVELTTNFTLSAANGTYADPSLKFTAPLTGKYRTDWQVRCSVNATGGGWIVGKIQVAGVDVTGSEFTMCLTWATGVALQRTELKPQRITATAGDVVRLMVTTKQATTWADRSLNTNTDGRSMVFYEFKGP